MPVFSREPSDQEIFRARVFDEPLVPMGARTSVQENQALSGALLAYLRGRDVENVSPILAFLEAHPGSAWSTSLLTDMGIVYRRTGHYSKALKAWEDAWTLGKHETDPRASAIADRALAELAELYSRLGRLEALETLLQEAEGRDVRGSATEKLSITRQGLWLMKNDPGKAFRCGPFAVRAISTALRGSHSTDPVIMSFESTARGTSLTQMRDLAGRVGIEMQVAFRERGSPLPLPALVHWRIGHFAALVGQAGGRYVAQDPTFGTDVSLGQATLDEEASGYFLVRAGPLPPGWRPVDEAEASAVWGKGQPAIVDPKRISPSDDTKGGECGAGPSIGMASYRFHSLVASLNIRDTPVGYNPPLGPAVNFEITYNQRDAFQPQIFSYSNLGSKWTFDWLSYVQDNPQYPGPGTVYLRGGGWETSGSTPDVLSRAVLMLVSSSPVVYERRLPDGSKDVFTQADGASTFPRRVFMTRHEDAQGNALTFTYDALLRLVGVTDAIGQVTTLSYNLPADPLKITSVTDPFGRSAQLDYDASAHLVRVTDVIGMASEFTYGLGDFVSSMTTPYGTTSLRTWEFGGINRALEATDPMGASERLEYAVQVPGLEPGPVPTGMAVFNPSSYVGAEWYNTFYWNKRAMALAPGDHSKAEIINWPGIHHGQIFGHINNHKLSLEGRVWYSYQGQAEGGWGPPSNAPFQPIAVGRVLDDGTSQVSRYEYNARGKKTKEIDPLGRETVYVYGNNNTPDANPTTGDGIDLLQVKRKNGAVYDILASYTYNAQHQPLTITDALGKTTTYTYNAAGQVLTVTTPPAQGHAQGATTTFTYDTYGYVQQASGPVPGANTGFTYDAYGRRRTVTDAAGLTVTYDYDALDRVTKVTYPDTTFEETVYNRLDAEKRRDRLGRWTQTFYDALRRPVAVKDPAGQTTQYQYGGSGCSSCASGGDKLTKLLDPNGNATSWEYDLQGRVSKETRADGGFESYTYETTSSRLKQKTDRKNVTTTYSYFLDGRLSQKSYSDTTPAVNYTYDPVDALMLTAANGTDTLTWTYDPLDRVATEQSTKNASTVGYNYDDAGNRTLLSLDGVTHVSYGYDQQSRLTSITRGSNTIGFGYDTPSRRTSMTYPNGIVTTYGYDTESRLTSLAANLGGTPITSFSYILDAVGNRTRKTTLDWAEDYGYDEVYRLKSADRSAGTPTRWRFAYDPAGNRTGDQTDDAAMGATFNNVNELQARQPGGVLAFKGTTNEPASVTVAAKPAQTTSTNTFTAQAPVTSGTTDVAVAATDPAGNVRTNTYRVTASGAGTTYTYDSNGNLTAKTEGPDTWGYEWNALNQLTRVTKNSVEQLSCLRSEGRRVENRGKCNLATYGRRSSS
jgi:YD repeat-containing protein